MPPKKPKAAKGRPELPPDEKRDSPLTIKFTAAEYADLEEDARIEDLPISLYARRLLKNRVRPQRK